MSDGYSKYGPERDVPIPYRVRAMDGTGQMLEQAAASAQELGVTAEQAARGMREFLEAFGASYDAIRLEPLEGKQRNTFPVAATAFALAVIGVLVLFISDWATGNDIPMVPWVIGWGLWGIGMALFFGTIGVKAVLGVRRWRRNRDT